MEHRVHRENHFLETEARDKIFALWTERLGEDHKAKIWNYEILK